MFEAGCIHFRESCSKMTRPVSSDATLMARRDEANSGRATISRMRARRSSSVRGAAAGVGCGVGVASGVGVCVGVGAGVCVGVGRAGVAVGRAGVGVGVGVEVCGAAVRRSRVWLCAAARAGA